MSVTCCVRLMLICIALTWRQMQRQREVEWWASQ